MTVGLSDSDLMEWQPSSTSPRGLVVARRNSETPRSLNDLSDLAGLLCTDRLFVNSTPRTICPCRKASETPRSKEATRLIATTGRPGAGRAARGVGCCETQQSPNESCISRMPLGRTRKWTELLGFALERRLVDAVEVAVENGFRPWWKETQNLSEKWRPRLELVVVSAPEGFSWDGGW
jgi:hypothetical protein